MRRTLLWGCVGMAVGGCERGPVSGDLLPWPEGETAVVLATVADDYSVGSLSAVSVETWDVYPDRAPVSGDPVVVVRDGVLYQVNRLGVDTIRFYDGMDWSVPRKELSVGPGSNPHDVEVCGERLFVSLYERDEMAVYSLTTGQLIQSIDLSRFADADGFPEASQMVRFGDSVYVALQRMNRLAGWTPEDQGWLVELDCESGEVLADWPVAPNPQLVESWSGDGRIWVVSPTGGVSALDVENGTIELGYADRADLNGEQIQDLVVGEQGATLMVTVAEDLDHYSVFCGNLDAGEIDWKEQTSSYLPDVAIHSTSQTAWIAARRGWTNAGALGGVLVYDLQTCASLTGSDWLQSTLAPVSIDFMPSEAI